MLDNQVIDPFSGVHDDDLALSFDGPYERIYKRQQARDPLALPAGPHNDGADEDLRASLLSGLAAVIVTAALFLGGIAAVVAPGPALAMSPHLLFL